MVSLRLVLIGVLLPASAVIAFGQDAATPDIDLLVKGLVHPDSSIRQSASTALGEAGADAAAPLVELVRTGDLGQAVSAAGVLTQVDAVVPGPVKGTLVAMLSSSEIEDWRWSVAATLLGDIDPQRTGLLAVFAARLNSKSPLVQSASLTAVTAIAPSLRDDQPEQVARVRGQLLDLLGRSRRPLTEIMLQPTTAGRGRVSFRAATPWLDDFVILRALQAAGLDESQMIALLWQRAHPGRSERVQLAAAEHLLELGPDGKRLAAKVLTRLLPNSFSRVRSSAVELATRLGPDGQPAVSGLTGVLMSPDADLRENAAIALGSMGAIALPALPDLAMALALEKTRGVSGKRVATALEDAIAKITANPGENP